MRVEFFYCNANCGLLGLLGSLTDLFEDPTALNFKASFNVKKTHKVTSDVVTMFRLHGIMVQNATISKIICPSQMNVSWIHTQRRTWVCSKVSEKPATSNFKVTNFFHMDFKFAGRIITVKYIGRLQIHST